MSKNKIAVVSCRVADTPKGVSLPASLSKRPCSRCTQPVYVMPSSVAALATGHCELFCRQCHARQMEADQVDTLLLLQPVGAAAELRDLQREHVRRN